MLMYIVPVGIAIVVLLAIAVTDKRRPLVVTVVQVGIVVAGLTAGTLSGSREVSWSALLENLVRDLVWGAITLAGVCGVRAYATVPVLRIRLPRRSAASWEIDRDEEAA